MANVLITLKHKTHAKINLRENQIELLHYISISPSQISALSVIISIFIIPTGGWMKVGILSVILFLDYLDGTWARLRKKTSQYGAVCDLIFDRMSEVLIFFTSPLIIIVMINYLLSYKRYKDKWFVLPIRQIYLVLIVIVLIMPGETITSLVTMIN